MATEKQVLLPDIGDFADVEIIEILVTPGDGVEAEQSLLTLESDKATIEIPSPFAGVVKTLQVEVGEKVSRGDLLLTLVADEPVSHEGTENLPDPVAEKTEPAQEPAAEELAESSKRLPGEKPPQHPPVMPRPSDLSAIAKGRKPHASPAVRRFARELGVDLTQVRASGPKGRILRDDVQYFVKQTLSEGVTTAAVGLPVQLPGAPEVDFARYGEIEVQPLPRLKKISGAHLHRCWITVPHVTQFDEADITELEAFRGAQREAAAAREIRLTLMPFLLKACSAALISMPQFNSSLSADGESLIYRQYIHIGVAVDTPNGLVVPVVRNVNHKGIFDLARELGEVSQKARDGKLLPGDMQGGCFSLSSLGGIGGTAFTPIVNTPEVAILGVSRAANKPVWDGTQFSPRLMLPLALSYDHRVIDGADGVRFTALLVSLLSDIRRLLL